MDLIYNIMTISNFYRRICLPVLFSVVLVSCNKETKQEERKVGEVPPTTNPAFMNLDGAAPAPANATQASPAGTVPAAQQVATTAPGMNPPHGQPNHRCDIAVGAPLNSPAGQGKTQPQPQQFSPPVQQPAAAPATATAPGMNPPHGQPGHRCEIAVGAPLP